MKVKMIMAAAAAFAASAAGPANAGVDILYDNLNPSLATGADPTATLGPLFASFSTGSSSVALMEADLLMYATDPGDGDSFQVSLWTSNPSTNLPSAVLWSKGFSDSILSTTPTVEDFFPTWDLTADTRYWIGLSSPGSVNFSSATSTAGIGVATEFYINSNGFVPNSDGPYIMRVVGLTIPEPSTWALMVAGFGGLGVAALSQGRKNRRAKTTV